MSLPFLPCQFSEVDSRLSSSGFPPHDLPQLKPAQCGTVAVAISGYLTRCLLLANLLAGGGIKHVGPQRRLYITTVYE